MSVRGRCVVCQDRVLHAIVATRPPRKFPPGVRPRPRSAWPRPRARPARRWGRALPSSSGILVVVLGDLLEVEHVEAAVVLPDLLQGDRRRHVRRRPFSGRRPATPPAPAPPRRRCSRCPTPRNRRAKSGSANRSAPGCRPLRLVKLEALVQRRERLSRRWPASAAASRRTRRSTSRASGNDCLQTST